MTTTTTVTHADARGLFHDVAARSGISVSMTLQPRDPATLTILDMMGGGCAFLDYDGDHRLDILLVETDHVELFRNRGDGTFENVTQHAFPGAIRVPYLMGCTVCDYDGDGRPDIFVTGHGRTILYHNEGDGTFKDVTAGSGLESRGPDDWTTSAAWADIDGDGKPDLYVCRYVQFNQQTKQLCNYDCLDGATLKMACAPTEYRSQRGSLYRNEGNGKFKDITATSGLAEAHGNGLGCMFCDTNGDGLPDLFIANDQRPQDLFINKGNGRFENISDTAGTAYDLNGKFIAGMGVDWGDYKNEGRFDLLVGTYSNQPKCLFHNEGKNLYQNDAAMSGLSAPSLTSLTFGAKFFDYDNDGQLDIVLVNGHVESMAEKVDSTVSYREATQLFHNEGRGAFKIQSSDSVGPDIARKIVGRGIAVGDYDGDGRLDLLIVDEEGQPLLLHNDGPTNHYLNIRCMGKNGKTYAIGANLALKSGGMSQMAEVRASGSYLSSDDPEVHFGMNSSTRVDSLTVRWPDGKSSHFASIDADHTYVVSHSDDKLALVR